MQPRIDAIRARLGSVPTDKLDSLPCSIKKILTDDLKFLETCVVISKDKYDELMRVLKHAKALEACVSRSPINKTHPKFLLKSAIDKYEVNHVS